MKVDKTTIVHGIPILTLRSALRRNQNASHTLPGFVDLLKIPAESAAQVLGKLVEDGLLTQATGTDWWENTVAGNALANATAGKKISRQAAEKALHQLIARASVVNQTEQYAFVVARILVFGSYLSDATELGDVDVFIELRKRFTDAARQSALEEEVNRRIPRTGDLIADIYRAQREVWKVLKAGSRSIQIAQSIPGGAKYTVVFVEGSQPATG